MELKHNLKPENLSREQKILLGIVTLALGNVAFRKSKWVGNDQFAASFFEKAQIVAGDHIQRGKRLAAEVIFSKANEVENIIPKAHKLSEEELREYEAAFIEAELAEPSENTDAKS